MIIPTIGDGVNEGRRAVSQSYSALLISLAVATSLAMSGCGDKETGTGTGPPAGGSRFRFVSGVGATDTVNTNLVQAVIVELRSETGALASGVVVRFKSLVIDSVPFSTLGVLVAPLSSETYSSFAVDSTNGSGRASILVKLGTRMGTAKLLVSVPDFGLEDTARFTILPGKPAHVVATPGDTVLYVGRSFQSRGSVTDQFGNSRTDPVTFAVLAGGITVSPTGTVTTGAVLERASYTVSAGCCSDTGWVSVVPPGTIAAYQTTTVGGHAPGIVLVNLDGSGYQWIAPGGASSNGVGPAWTPSGTQIAFGTATGALSLWLSRTDLSGGVQPLVTVGDSGLTLTAWPAYSPDGATLYFSGTTNNNFGLWRANADGSEPHLLYADPSGLAWRESPSPDGTRLAFTASNPPVVRVYTLASHTVLPWSVLGHTPRWSPAGTMIAYTTQFGGPVYVVNPDGTGSRQVSPVGRTYTESSLTWSSDGAWLVARGPTSLELINVTSRITLPLGYATTLIEAAWKP